MFICYLFCLVACSGYFSESTQKLAFYRPDATGDHQYQPVPGFFLSRSFTTVLSYSSFSLHLFMLLNMRGVLSSSLTVESFFLLVWKQLRTRNFLINCDIQIKCCKYRVTLYSDIWSLIYYKFYCRILITRSCLVAARCYGTYTYYLLFSLM